MEWKYKVALKDDALIEQFEQRYNVQFPQDFKDVVRKNNAGYPTPAVYGEREAKALLSFNPTDEESIWEAVEIMQQAAISHFIPFMIDDFGNYIGFYLDPLEDELPVVFMDRENGYNTTLIASDFSAFLKQFE